MTTIKGHMLIVTDRTLANWESEYPTAVPTLRHWKEVAKGQDFGNLVELRRAFPSADQVIVASGRPVVVFNIKRQFRLIAAIHFNHRTIYLLRFLTHAQYDTDKWKAEL
jgi:mRNA interferase HigB